MNLDYHLESTGELFDNAAARLESAAKELRRLKQYMTKNRDLSYAGEAISVIVCLPQQCRTDLFATRPIRAIQYGEEA